MIRQTQFLNRRDAESAEIREKILLNFNGLRCFGLYVLRTLRVHFCLFLPLFVECRKKKIITRKNSLRSLRLSAALWGLNTYAGSSSFIINRIENERRPRESPLKQRDHEQVPRSHQLI